MDLWPIELGASTNKPTLRNDCRDNRQNLFTIHKKYGHFICNKWISSRNPEIPVLRTCIVNPTFIGPSQFKQARCFSVVYCILELAPQLIPQIIHSVKHSVRLSTAPHLKFHSEASIWVAWNECPANVALHTPINSHLHADRIHQFVVELEMHFCGYFRMHKCQSTSRMHYVSECIWHSGQLRNSLVCVQLLLNLPCASAYLSKM